MSVSVTEAGAVGRRQKIGVPENLSASANVLGVVMAALYDSEINCSISCFWDGGWDVKLGDEMNGFVAESNFDSLYDVARFLREQAVKHFPHSDFAALYVP